MSSLEQALKHFRERISGAVMREVAEAMRTRGLEISPEQVKEIDELLVIEWHRQTRMQGPALSLVK
jgi:hypothetical protein